MPGPKLFMTSIPHDLDQKPFELQVLDHKCVLHFMIIVYSRLKVQNESHNWVITTNMTTIPCSTTNTNNKLTWEVC